MFTYNKISIWFFSRKTGIGQGRTLGTRPVLGRLWDVDGPHLCTEHDRNRCLSPLFVALGEAHCPIFCMRMELEGHVGDEGGKQSSSGPRGQRADRKTGWCFLQLREIASTTK